MNCGLDSGMYAISFLKDNDTAIFALESCIFRMSAYHLSLLQNVQMDFKAECVISFPKSVTPSSALQCYDWLVLTVTMTSFVLTLTASNLNMSSFVANHSTVGRDKAKHFLNLPLARKQSIKLATAYEFRLGHRKECPVFGPGYMGGRHKPSM